MLSVDARLQLSDFELNVAFEAPPGMTTVIGKNGAGKSTILKIILGVLKPSSGVIALGGQYLVNDNRNIPTEFRQIGYVPQRYALFPHMTVARNVEFGIKHLTAADRHHKAISLLEDLGVAHLAKRKPRNLSGGEAQRVALARALAIEPRLLLLDEPMSALDAQAKRSVRQFLASHLSALDIPTVIVSHDAADVHALGGRVVVIDQGKVIQTGSIDELMSKPASSFVTDFLDLGRSRRADD